MNFDNMTVLAEVKAPANIKIGGEHSVVYGGPSLSAAVELYATSTVEDNDDGTLKINLPDLGKNGSYSSEELKKLYVDFSARDKSPPKTGSENRTGIREYIVKHADVNKEFLPYVTIASRLHFNYGIDVLGKTITVHSDVPRQSGYASSAVCSASLAMALVKTSKIRMSDQDAIDLIRDGERVQHAAEGSGRIDVGPAYFGGYVQFYKDETLPLDTVTSTKFVVFDTGPKPATSEMVGKVREFYNKETDHVSKILKNIDDCVVSDISALRAGDLKTLGESMTRNHELLRDLGVSSEGLDAAVSVATSNGALGAKMCGGGGGGIGIALVEDNASATTVINALREQGFKAYVTALSKVGAKMYI